MAGQTTHPGFAGVVSYESEELPNDTNLATAVTVQRMGEYAAQDAGSAEVQRVLNSLQRSNGLLSGIHSWIRDRVRFVTDARNAQAAQLWNPAEVELLIRPRDLLHMTDPSGDCDDFSMLTAALLIGAGLRAAFVTIAANPDAPEQWSHVYVLAITPWGNVPMDTSHGPAPGWEYPHAIRKQIWPIGANSVQQLGDVNLINPDGGYGSQTPDVTGGIDWNRILTQGFDTAGTILTARYGQPPPGTYQQTGPNGSVFYRQQAGDNTIPFFPASGSSSTGSLLLLGIAALAVLLIANKN